MLLSARTAAVEVPVGLYVHVPKRTNSDLTNSRIRCALSASIPANTRLDTDSRQIFGFIEELNEDENDDRGLTAQGLLGLYRIE